ncbi:MAG TPA: DUF2157 domain-containing protein [Lacunisphaera sp.]|nr:DUF2157 domain-containing protein [Lacunisphaera sp.]
MKPEEHLAEWADAWVADGLVTPAQRDAIVARHPVPAGGANRFLAILAGIGGSLLVVGVSLVIKANWDQLGDWLKIGGLLALLGGSYALGWRLKIAPGHYPKTGDACLMMGAVFFLLGITLVSQIFHLDSRPANGVLLWWAGIVVLPWMVQAKGMQFVSVIAGLVWLGMELAADDGWLRLAGTGYHVDAEYLFAACGVLVGLALLLFGLGLRHGRHGFFAGVHEKTGLLLACVSLYGLGFTWSVHKWMGHGLDRPRLESVLAVALLATAGGAWAWLRNFADLKPLAWALLPALLPAFAHLLGLDLGDSGWLWGGLACLALFLLNLGMIRTGLATGRESWINVGIGFIALNIITRYFLLFGSMLDGGVFFIVTGLLVLGLGWYLERKRRALVGAMRREVTS